MIRTLQRAHQRARHAVTGPKAPTRVRPDDAPEAHASGPDPVRVLLAGGDILTGWGVRTHNLTIPGHLARTLAASTGRGVDISIAIDPHTTAAQLLWLLDGRRLDTVHAVVLHLGLADVQRLTPVTEWTAGLEVAVDHLRGATASGTLLTIVGIPIPSLVPYLHAPADGILDEHAQQLNDATAQLCQNHQTATFLPAPNYRPAQGVEQPFGRPDHFLHWARHEAAHLLPHFTLQNNGPTPADEPALPLLKAPCPTADTGRRMRALNRLTWGTDTHARIEKIVQHAKALIDVDTVTFAIATTDELVHYIHTGDPVENVPLEGSFCWHTLQQCDTLIIPDTWAVNPDWTRFPARFYAAHPVLAPDGTPIGTLCLLASQPPAEDIDRVLLRDFTLQIQHTLSTPAELPA